MCRQAENHGGQTMEETRVTQRIQRAEVQRMAQANKTWIWRATMEQEQQMTK